MSEAMRIIRAVAYHPARRRLAGGEHGGMVHASTIPTASVLARLQPEIQRRRHRPESAA